jgi:uncharacterized membrane protein
VSSAPGSTPPDELERGLAFERLVFFSDAVFAIAITLLIIEVRLPALPNDATSQQLLDALRQIAPEVFVYVLSFWTIGLYWLAHWRRYRFIARVNERLVALNLVLLALIAFIPFPTAVIGEHGDLVPAVVLYALALSAAGVAGPLTWVYAWRNGLTVPGIEPGYARLAALRGFSVPVVMLGTLPLLLVVGTQVVELLWFLIIPVQIAMNRLVDAKAGPAL